MGVHDSAAMTDKLVPSFLPITTQECMDKFMAFDLFDVVCLKFTISKALGYAIVLGAVGVKLPQMLNIVKAGTVAGLTSSTYILELACCTIFGMYNMRKGFAFSTYGENVFLALQNLVLMYCFTAFPAVKGGEPPIKDSSQKLMVTLGGLMGYCAVIAGLYFSIPPGTGSPSTLELALVAAPNVLILFARLPQIAANFSNKSTGVLSVVTQSLNTAGCLARVFTTLQEVDDFAILATALASTLNLIILSQIIFYWSNTADQLNE